MHWGHRPPLGAGARKGRRASHALRFVVSNRSYVLAALFARTQKTIRGRKSPAHRGPRDNVEVPPAGDTQGRDDRPDLMTGFQETADLECCRSWHSTCP